VLCAAEPVTLLSMKVAGPLFGIAMLGMTAGLTMAGVAVLRAGTRQGAARFSLLATGAYIPLVMVPSMFLPGLWFHYAIGIWGLTFLWLAVTVLRAQPR
jgi:hypothetical protein